MSLKFSPELYEILGNGGIVLPTPSTEAGGDYECIGPGLYRFTMPDGRQIVIDENGNIIG